MYHPELPDPNASLVLILIWLLIIMIFFCFFVSFSEHPVIPDPYASFFITLNFLVVLQRCQLLVNNQLIMYQPELPDPNASLVLILIWLLIIMIFFCVFVSFSEHPELPDPYASFLIILNFCFLYLTATGHVFCMFFQKDQLPVIYFLKLKVCTDL